MNFLRWFVAPLGLALSATLAGGASVRYVQVETLDIPGVSSPAWESHPTEDPLTHDLWFVRSDRNFEGWRIWMARCEGGRFLEARPSPIPAQGLEADPVFVDHGRRLLFISTRETGSLKSADLDIWESVRTDQGWSTPARLPSPINSDRAEWFPRIAPDGWLYFGSGRSGGQGKTDIWRAKWIRGAWSVENLGADLNTSENEYELSIAPDGRTGLLATDQGIFSVRKAQGVWRRTAKLDRSINANGTEIGPAMLPDRQGFLFSRDLGAERSGEILVGRKAGEAGSPLACLARRRAHGVATS